MTNYFCRQDHVESVCIYGAAAKSDVQLTIVVPTYKRRKLLAQTLKSIIEQIQPKTIRYQVIVVSNEPDLSVDSLDITLDPQIFSIYCNEENLGMAGNMNRCARIAAGEYVAYIQDDDILLEDYLISFEALYQNGKLDGVDCMIPNRYFLYDETDDIHWFGRKAYIKEKKKAKLKSWIPFGSHKEDFRKINAIDCAKVWHNFFGGGPTCGVTFKREALMQSNGFDETYPYGFDLVFFVDFSYDNIVMLYDRYLSIYRMSNSASNRPEVQKDFFRGSMYMLERTIGECRYVRFFKNEIIKFCIDSKSKETAELLKATYLETNTLKGSAFKYYFYRAMRLVLLMCSSLYRLKLLPEDLRARYQ